MRTVSEVTDNSRLIGVILGPVAAAAMIGVAALKRRRTIDDGVSAMARILHVDVVDHGRVKGQRYLAVQLAIPLPDGTEITAVATVGYSASGPKVGWTVPVRYIERFGSTTKVEIVGRPRP